MAISPVDMSQDAHAGASIAPWVRALRNIASPAGCEGDTFPGLLGALATTFGDKVALESERDSLTYCGLARLSEHYAAWACAAGVARGDVVGLLMPNRAAFVAVWAGIGRAGAATALINTGLSGQALLHVITTAGCRHLIVAAELAQALHAVAAELPAGLSIWLHDAHGAPPPGWQILDPQVYTLSQNDGDGVQARATETALLIFTSGTTGLPKAARLSHRKVLEWSHWFAGMLDTGASDRLYDCLPMYHSTGGVACLGAVLTRGGTVVLREHLSVRRFWDDIAGTGCTLLLYIGEMCRYLTGAPAHAMETTHRLRLACGNGLREDVWRAFQTRFKIPRILEFYASTEGNVSLYNCEGRPGAVGRVPGFLAHRFPVALIECDGGSGEPLRTPSGFCIKCAADLPGEAIGRIEPGDGAQAFEGYTDKDATNTKILRNVFSPGDSWFRTGDLMRRDGAGFYYFLDRMGDTYRWKGENVSTTQVAETICRCDCVIDAVAYGVQVPGTEGRAGMAALVVGEKFSLAHLHAHVATHLPPYARPLFLRLCVDLKMTGTFKPMKQSLMQDAYDPAKVTDSLYFNDSQSGGYSRIDAALYEDILAQRIAL